jgi:hypothetical protein
MFSIFPVIYIFGRFGRFVSVVSVVSVVSFRSFRFGRFGGFGRFVSTFRLLVHALLTSLLQSFNEMQCNSVYFEDVPQHESFKSTN